MQLLNTQVYIFSNAISFLLMLVAQSVEDIEAKWRVLNSLYIKCIIIYYNENMTVLNAIALPIWNDLLVDQ